MHFSYSAIAVTALTLGYAIAQPAHHRHHYKHRRAEIPHADTPDLKVRNVDTVDVSGVDWSKIDWSKVAYTQSGQQDPPPSTDGFPFFGGTTPPHDNGNKDEYIGNVGKPYGTNMKKVAASDAGKCKYSIKFVYNGPTSKKIQIWNKSGRDGRPQSGMGDEPNMYITLGPGESQFVCFDENSQIGFSEDCPRNKLQGNLPDCTWGEADFGDLRNGRWSGWDRSSIPNTAGNTGYLTVSCPKGKTSSQEYNSFTDVSQEDAGGAAPPGPIDITAEWR